jgi:hypothetical protein
MEFLRYVIGQKLDKEFDLNPDPNRENVKKETAPLVSVWQTDLWNSMYFRNVFLTITMLYLINNVPMWQLIVALIFSIVKLSDLIGFCSKILKNTSKQENREL